MPDSTGAGPPIFWPRTPITDGNQLNTQPNPPGTNLDFRAVIMHHERLPSGLYEVFGLIGRGRREEFEETRGWPVQPYWARDPSYADAFAIHYHNVHEMRKKYPSITLYVDRGIGAPEPGIDWGWNDLLDDVFDKFQYVEVEPRFYLPPHNVFQPVVDMDHREHLRVYLFEIGSGDFFDFGGLMDDVACFGAAFLLSERPRGLATIKGLIEGSHEAVELLGKLMEPYGVLYYPNNEGDFILVTGDGEVAQAFTRNPQWRLVRGRRRKLPGG